MGGPLRPSRRRSRRSRRGCCSLVSAIAGHRRRTARASEPLPDFLLVDRRAVGRATSRPAILAALAALLLIGVFYYLFRASGQRRGCGCRAGSSTSIVIGPVFYAISQVLGALDAHRHRRRVRRRRPPIRGKAGEDCAKDLRSDVEPDRRRPLSLAGTLAMAFLFVMLPLRARRVGLLSRSWGSSGCRGGADRAAAAPRRCRRSSRRSGSARWARSSWAAGPAVADPPGRAARPSRGRLRRSGAAPLRRRGRGGGARRSTAAPDRAAGRRADPSRKRRRKRLAQPR